MAQAAASAQDRDPLAGLGLRLLQCLVGGHAGAQDGGRLGEAQGLGDLADVGRQGHSVLCEAPVGSESCLVLLAANGLPAGQAVVAITAGVVQPGMADAITDGQGGDSLSELHDDSSTLVTRDDGQLGLHDPVTLAHMQVGVAHTRGDDLDQNLAVARLRDWDVLHDDGLSELLDDGSLHGCRDGGHLARRKERGEVKLAGVTMKRC
mmetsp:Transcript_79432/g.174210  ORF Transcript_79432/g.174210 Transcript_79432/m.174210 type:complete len:207 (-) Transcript_79432:31-651(-)